jgi:CMP-N,N'-diacetyllegionaminic acid synthase
MSPPEAVAPVHSAAEALEVLALVPARGGSKSVPRKNLRDVGGRPLIPWSIEQARRARLVDRVIVTTDDAEIAEVARGWGAEVPFLRPRELAQDLSLDIDYQLHALGWLAERESYRPDLIVTLRPPMPVRRVSTIDRAIQALAERPDAHSLRSVKLATETPYKMWAIGGTGLLEPIASVPGLSEPFNMPRQALPPVYWQDGYIDVAWTRTVLEQRSSSGSRILPFLIEETYVDIDYEEAIVVAERLLARMDAAEPGAASRGPRHPS